MTNSTPAKTSMVNGWQTVSLEQVLQQDTDYVTELEPITYPKLSVKLYGKGVTLDAPADGANVKMQRHQFARPGQVILSEIWAKKGAIGIVPPDGEGALVTSHFFLFDIDETKILPAFIGWLLKGNSFAELLDAQAHGTTGYAAVRPKQFLALEIPLPPLMEQRRIVRRIEALAGRVAEAQSLRREADDETELIFEKSVAQVFDTIQAEHKKLSQVAEKKTGQAYKSDDFSETGEVPVVRLTEIRTKKPVVYLRNPEAYNNVWLEEGDIVFAKTSMATGSMCMWNNIKAVLNQNAIMLRANRGIDQKFLYYWLQQYVFRFLAKKLADPNYYPYIREGDLMSSDVPVPPLEEQRRLVAYLDGLQAQVSALRAAQAETGKELSALMPSILDKAFKGEL